MNDLGTEAVLFGQRINIYVREKVRRVGMAEIVYPNYGEVPTGKLCFKCGRYYRIKEWSDGRQSVEEKIPEIIRHLEAEARELVAVEEDRNILRGAREEDERIQKEKRQVNEKEVAKFKSFLQAARRHHESEMMRKYLSTLKHRKSSIRCENHEVDTDLIEWAERKINWYDPIIEADDDSMSNVDRNTLQFR